MSAHSIKLNGAWEFKEYPLDARKMSDLDQTEWNSVSVPCSLYDGLIEIGKIDGTDLTQNPEKYTWFSNRPWVFRKTFDVPEEILQSDRQELVFKGLDTVVSIWLNGELITRTSNMFIPHRRDVTGLLKSENNTVLIKFEAPEPYARKMMNRYIRFDKSKIINPWRAYIRKGQFQFGWDFCPSLPGCGIFDDVVLEGTNKARLKDIYARTISISRENADLKVTAELDRAVDGDYTGEFTLTRNGEAVTSQRMEFTSQSSSHSLILSVLDPDLWYPQGYGEQNLYNLKISLKDDKQTLEEKSIPVGIRTVQLDRSGTRRNQEFRIYINDVPVHIRGANWVPPSVMTGAITDDDYRRLIETAADANINMLRVWGGGVYESDEFYRLCNEKGIMVWQDFMFACSYYPDRKWFREKVATEASTVIKRLRNNPSLCIWCGNNEIDWMHHSSALGSKKKFHGKSIFHKLLPDLLEELDPDKPYIPSTPIGTDSKELNSPDNGAIHNWGFWHGYAPVSELQCPLDKAPRFVTEFGIQSPPNYETVKKFFPGVTRYSQMEFEKHNFDMAGSGKIQRYISEFFPAPESLEKFIYLAQVTQARCVKTYAERLRAAKTRNGGVLFWQFNEPMPVICWSAVDYNKTPKALIYYAKRFYAPRAVIAVPVYCESSAGKPKRLKDLNVTAVNDTPASFTGTINCLLEKFSGEIIDKVSLPVSIQPFGNSPLIKIPKAIASPEDPRSSLLHLSLDTPHERIAENFYTFLPDKYLDFEKPEIDIDTKPADKGHTRLIIKSSNFVKDLCIETGKGLVMGDNFIDLPAGRELELMIPAEVTREQLNLRTVNECI